MWRFSIRDLCWVMFVVGFSLWTLDYRRQIRSVQRAYLERTTEEIARRQHAERALEEAQYEAAEYSKRTAQVISELQVEVERLRRGEPAIARVPRLELAP